MLTTNDNKHPADERKNKFVKSVLKIFKPEIPETIHTMICALWAIHVMKFQGAMGAVEKIPHDFYMQWTDIKWVFAGLSEKALSNETDAGHIKAKGSGEDREWNARDIVTRFLIQGAPFRYRHRCDPGYVNAALRSLSQIPELKKDSKKTADTPAPKKNEPSLPEPSNFVSPSKIAGLAMPDTCRKCVWIGLRFKDRILKFPSVFRDIDQWIRYQIELSFDQFGVPPVWIPKQYQEAVGVIKGLSWRNFQRFDEQTGLTLRGVPDTVFVNNSGATAEICDWKTAKLSEFQKKFSARYIAQLNCYSWISEAHSNIPPVTDLSLGYCEPPDMRLNPDMPFGDNLVLPLAPTVIPVEINHQRFVREILDEAKELITMEVPPLSNPDCEDCRTSENLSKFAYLI